MKKNPKISIITLVKNGMPYIQDCILSFELQKYKNKELIVIYSNSEDNTFNILKKNKNISKLIIDNNSKSLYSSLNLGLKYSTGDLIGILHSDDIFFNENVLSNVAKEYLNKKFEIGYGNIIISRSNRPQKVIRIWRSELFKKSMLKFGWMPPHVSMFISRELKNEGYLENYKISSDYDYIIKLFRKYNNIRFFNKYTTIMRSGGLSNTKILLKFKEDLKISKNLFLFSHITIFLKIVRKIGQFIVLNRNLKNTNYLKNFCQYKYNIIKDANFLLKKKKCILSAFNMAFLSYVHNKIIFDLKFFWIWPDGFISNIFLKKKKIPGRYILQKLKNQNHIKNIYLISGRNNKNIKYLKNKFKNKNFYFIEAPFGDSQFIINKVSNKIKKIKSNNLILLGLPTPKQEHIASFISQNLNEYRVLCLGGSINYNSKDTKIPPKFFENYFESIWRLQNDTFRRTLRLLSSIMITAKRIIFGELRDIK